MITGIHILLTYACTGECDHCFLYCSPSAKGTFSLDKFQSLFDQIRRVKHIDWVYFEGGEPFLFYPLMLEGFRLAKEQGLKAGVVTNAYWATTEQDAEVWLKPLRDLGVADLSLSDDEFHGDGDDRPARWAHKAAQKLKIPVDSICIEKPSVTTQAGQKRGEPVIGGGVMFRGRAAKKLTQGLPIRPLRTMTTCPHEDLEHPSRVHIDAYGNVHLCQGLVMGNIWQTPLPKLLVEYDPHRHPICAPLIEGGPYQLAKVFGLSSAMNCVEECHYCYHLRRKLLRRFPQFLGPPQVYDLK